MSTSEDPLEDPDLAKECRRNEQSPKIMELALSLKAVISLTEL